MLNVFISIITFNNNETTLKCLESLNMLRLNNINLTVVVVDNSTKEKFNLSAKFNKFNIKIIKSIENLGFSGGQNLGIKYALSQSADYVLVLNNDVVVDDNLITELLNSFRENVGIVVPKIYFAKGYEFHKNRYLESEKGKVIWYAGGIVDWKNVMGIHNGVDEVDLGQFDENLETEYATGCCMMVKKEVFENVGNFDEKYFLYLEDLDLSIRVKRKGYKIIFNPKAKLWHKNAISAGGSGSDLQDYYISRNRLIFGFKYASLIIRIALIKESIRLLINGRKWQKIGIKDFYLFKFGKGSGIK